MSSASNLTREAPSSSISAIEPSTFQFPRFSPESKPAADAKTLNNTSPSPATSPSSTPHDIAFKPNRREYKRDHGAAWYKSRGSYGNPGRMRQKSISDAFRIIKGRRASVSENVHELAGALKAPLSPKLVLLCGVWYMASVFSNASSKSILIAFRFPVTLTLVQFAFVSSWCIFSSYLARIYPPLRKLIPVLKHEILSPSRELIITTLPLTAFQVGGHILNSDAMSRIPVSLVHTIKGLSPLLTVLAYRIVFNVRCSTPTYLSLIPLTFGVIMATSANFSGNFLGLSFAFGSTILFVTQNIVSKKLFSEAEQAEAEGQTGLTIRTKPDKLNLLCYSSGLAFLITAPLWVWSEGFTLLQDFLSDGAVELSKRPDALDHGRLALEFIFNGTFHFAQSLVAFVLLSMVSPVTYSVASLIKRVFVICFAIVWFGNPVTRIQGFGIALTFLGLYLYDRTNDASKADRRAKLLHKEQPLLPLIAEDRKPDVPVFSPSPVNASLAANWGLPINSTQQFSSLASDKKDDGDLARKPHAIDTTGGWLPPGTKQEETWTPGDQSSRNGVSVA